MNPGSLPRVLVAVGRSAASGPAMVMLSEHARIAVVGASCSGKTTLSRALASALGRPHIELDALYWGPAWTPRADFAVRAAEAIAAPAWIADGNYQAVRAAVWSRASALVWLNLRFDVVFRRALARTARRAWSGEELYAGNRESVLRALFDPQGVPWWIVRTHRRRQREYRALLGRPEFSHLTVFELHRPQDVDALVRATAASLPPPG